jgi:hypothetical protein
MADLPAFEKKLNQDAAFRALFFENPSKTMKEAGFELTDEMKQNLEKVVADFKATKKLPAGAELAKTADTNVGVGIGIRVGGGM